MTFKNVAGIQNICYWRCAFTYCTGKRILHESEIFVICVGDVQPIVINYRFIVTYLDESQLIINGIISKMITDIMQPPEENTYKEKIMEYL